MPGCAFDLLLPLNNCFFQWFFVATIAEIISKKFENLEFHPEEFFCMMLQLHLLGVHKELGNESFNNNNGF